MPPVGVVGIVHGTDDIVVQDHGRFQISANGLAGDGQAFFVEQPSFAASSFMTAGMPPARVQVFDMMRAAGAQACRGAGVWR